MSRKQVAQTREVRTRRLDEVREARLKAQNKADPLQDLSARAKGIFSSPFVAPAAVDAAHAQDLNA